MREARSIFVCVVVIAAGLIAFASPAAAVVGPHLSELTTFTGNGGYSADGLGQTTTGGLIQADVPSGSTVQKAYLYGSYFDSDPTVSDRTIDFDGTSVVLDSIAQFDAAGEGVFYLTTARADVTSQVSTKVGSGGGITNFAVNSDPSNLTGVGLVVIYSNPGSPAVKISVVDGAANPAGDSAIFSFPPFPSGGSAQMSLGSGFSFQGGSGAGTHECGTESNQSSEINVNIEGERITSCAGNYDDGSSPNGALITVGGVDDSTNNPADPFQHPGDAGTPRVEDDELYDLSGFIPPGDTTVSIHTANPSGDDNLFLAVVSTTVPSADLAITKTDGNPVAAPGYGPDPVSSGNVVAYKVGVTNNGPNTATGITVNDYVSESGGTIVGASGTNWDCTIDGSATCTRVEGSDSLGSGATAEPIRIEVQAPATGTNATIDDTATVSGNESDSNSANNTDTESTTVSASGTADHAAGFCSGATTCTVSTDPGTGATKTDPTVSIVTIPAAATADPQTITLSESTSTTLCGGGPCQGQVVEITSNPPLTFAGVTDPNHPAVLTMIFDKSVKQGSQVYIKKGTAAPKLVKNCTTAGIAIPHPCVSAKNITLPNGDREFIILFLEGDPIIGKR